MATIGARVLRLEDRSLLTGQGRFVDDIPLPGVLHVAFARSREAHALIRKVDKAAACAIPGVRAVLTLADLDPVLVKRRLPRTSAKPGSVPDTPFILAGEEVAFVGEAVALVVADSRYLAEDGAALVDIDSEPLPIVADCRDAAESTAPPVRREAASNVMNRYALGYGDIDAAFRGARVFAETLYQHRGLGHPLEGRGLLVEVSAGGDRFTIHASTQMPHELFHMLAELMDLDENALRVAQSDLGGGFGPKYAVYPEEVAVVAAAKLLGCSLKWVEDRREHFASAVQERDQYWSLEIAVDEAGRIRGLRGRLLHDLGAYALKDANLPYNSATSVTGPYLVPAYAIEVTIVHTNKVPTSSVRGAGHPQPAFAMERLMDRVARELALDRAEVRRRNLIPPEKMPYEKPLKARSGASIVYDSGDYPACQREILAAAGWEGFPQRQAEARAMGRFLGIGLANAVKGTGRGPFESGVVRIASPGRISVFTGAAAMGQGLKTALAQICADCLGVSADRIAVIAGDTAGTPLGLGGFASRQLVTAGSSVLLAARAVADKAKRLASHMLEAAEEDLELVDGAVRVVGAPQLSVSLGALARVLRGAPGYGFPAGIEPGLDASVHWRTEALAYANASHVAEVEVDVETGGVRLLRYLAIQDSGRLINPMIVDGQVRGGIAHGIGNALFEWMGYDAQAQPVTTSFADYLIPTATELPRFETFYKESPSPINPLGAKGVGEVGTIPAAAAVISAVEDALSPFGVTIARTPISPPQLLALINERRDRGSF